MNTQQVVIIGGGETFDSHDDFISTLREREIDLERLRPKIDWKNTLQTNLGDSFEVFAPRMPNASNAQYDEWALWFSRILPLLSDNVILIGHSLGGIFLVRYLAEHEIDQTIAKTILIAAPFSDTPDESLASFRLPEDPAETLQRFAQRAGVIHIFHSTDDPVVPYHDALQYQEVLPNATLHTFEDRKHFNTEEFPALITLLRESI